MEDVLLRVETRYDNVDQGRVRNRLQGAIRLGMRADFNDVFDLVVFLTTGDNYTSRWSTFRNYAGAQNTDPLNLHLRQVYAQIERDGFRIHAGAIPPVKNVVSPTGLEPIGWIDGARFEWFNAPNGTVEFGIGRLGSLDTPNAFARPTPFLDPSVLNYLELEISQQVGTPFLVEASAEYFIDPYMRGEIRYLSCGGIEAFAEALFNLDHKAINTGVTLLFNELPRGLSFRINHAFKAETIGIRGELADDFFTFGHSFTLRPAGVISRRWGLSWNVETIFAERPASFETGIPDRTSEGVYTRLKIVVQWRV